MQPAVSSVRGAPVATAPHKYSLKATRIAAKINPPTLLVEYRACAAAFTGASALPTDTDSKRVREFQLTNLKPDADVSRLTTQVLHGLPRALDPGSISSDKVQQLLARIIAASNEPPATFLGIDPGHAVTPPGSPQHPSRTNPTQRVPTADGAAESHPLDDCLSASSADSSDVDGSLSNSTNTSRSPSAVTYGFAGGATAAVAAVPVLSFASLHSPAPEDQPPLLRRNRDPDPPLQQPPAAPCPPQEGAAEQPPAATWAAAAAAVLASKAAAAAAVPQAEVTAAAAAPPPPPPLAAAAAAAAPRARVTSDTASEVEEEDCLVMEMSYGEDVDLNKVTDYELQLAKERMEDTFAANAVRPGDPDYVYDKQVEFTGPIQNNEWDDDD